MLCRGLSLVALLIAPPLWAGSSVLDVSFAQLQKDPWRFNGKRVSVTAYLTEDGWLRESPRAARRADDDSICVNILWKRAEALAQLPKLRLKNRFMRIVGTFEHLDMTPEVVGPLHDPDNRILVRRRVGFCGGLASQITQITGFTPVARNEEGI